MSIGFLSPLDAATFAQARARTEPGPLYVIAENEPGAPTTYSVETTTFDTDTVLAVVVSGGGVAWKSDEDKAAWRRYWAK